MRGNGSEDSGVSRIQIHERQVMTDRTLILALKSKKFLRRPVSSDALRLVLEQPSPSWKQFGIRELQVLSPEAKVTSQP
jgi:hypothetical protein